MPMPPQIEAANQLIIDLADNPDLREIFSGKQPGHKCRLTMDLQVMAKTQETVTLAIEKITTDPSDYHTDSATPTLNEPIMATMNRNRKKSKREEDMPMGKHNNPPRTAENSAEPWMKSYT